VISLSYLATATIAFIAASCKAPFARKHHPSSTRAVSCLALFTLGLAFLSLTRPSRRILDHLTGVPALGQWLGNSLILAAACSFLILLSQFTRPLGGRQPRTRIRVIILFITVIAMGLISLGQRWKDSYDIPGPGAPGLAALAYLLIYLSYQGVIMAGALRLCWRFAPHIPGRSLRLGMRIVASGSLTCLVHVAYGAVFVLSRWSGLPTLGRPGVAGPLLGVFAAIQIIVGTTLDTWGPTLGRSWLWARQWRSYRRLRRLWAALSQAVPQIALPPPRGTRHDVRFRLYRRVIEIRDGELALRPYRDPQVAEDAAAIARAEGLSGDALDTTVEAIILSAALEAKNAGHPGRHNNPAADPAPGPDPDLESETAWLLMVSRAFTRSSAVRRPACHGLQSASGRKRDGRPFTHLTARANYRRSSWKTARS
jgi:hypothetical protein